MMDKEKTDSECTDFDWAENDPDNVKEEGTLPLKTKTLEKKEDKKDRPPIREGNRRDSQKNNSHKGKITF